MSRLRGWFVRLGALLGLGRRGRDLDAELESHLQLHADDFLRAGMSPDDARREARLTLGSVESIREAYRDQDGVPALRLIGDAARHGVRSAIRHPGFAASVVAILGVGVGATAAMVGVVDALLFRPPAHVRAPGALVRVASAVNFPQYEMLERHGRALDVTTFSKRTLSLGEGETARPIETQCVTASFFRVLGASLVVGRGFAASDDEPGAPPTVVLGHDVWRAAFAGDPGIAGRSVRVAGTPHVVVGVAPAEFRGLEMAAVDAWILVRVSPAVCSLTGVNALASTNASWLTTIGRLRDGVTLAQAETEVRGLSLHLMRPLTRDEPSRELVPAVESRANSASRDRRLALWLAAGAGLVLLIACANVAGLLSVRAIERRREVAVRMQLGAGRGRVFLQLLAENLTLTGASGLAAWIVAGWIGGALRAFFPAVAHSAWNDTRAMAVLAVFIAAAGLLSGVVPAAQTARASGVSLWRSGRPMADARSRLRNSLIVLQVAVALVLVVGAGLFARSVGRVTSELGYEPHRVIVATIDLERAGIRRQVEQRRIFDEMLHNVRRLPDVEAAALATASPLGSGQSYAVMPGGPPGSGAASASRMFTSVTPEYFAVLGTRVIDGRAFTPGDVTGSQAVAIVDEETAREMWPGQRVVGRCLEMAQGQPCLEIVGLSEPRRIGSLRQTAREIFHPLAQNASRVPQAIVVRPAGSVGATLPAVAAAIRASAPNLPYVSVRPLEELVDVRARSWRLGAGLFGLFGGVAVALSAVGLYVSLAFAVRQRTAEIGVRMTLGADAREIARMVVRQGAGLVAIGWIVGLTASAALAGAIESLLYGVAPFDPVTFAGASVVVAVAGLLGCVIPAMRASRVDPVVALRME